MIPQHPKGAGSRRRVVDTVLSLLGSSERTTRMTLNHGLRNLRVSHDTLLQSLPADPANSAWTDNHPGAGSRGALLVPGRHGARSWLPLHHHTRHHHLPECRAVGKSVQTT